MRMRIDRVDKRTIYYKVDLSFGLTFYYRTDITGEFGNYGRMVKDTLKTKFALEWDIEKDDVTLEMVWSCPRKYPCGSIEKGEIIDGVYPS